MPMSLKILVAAALVCACFTISAQGSAEAAPQPLTVWLPAALISDESGRAYQLLSEHAANFANGNDIAVEFRIKATEGVGGILSTIRAGKEVAPAALPDLTLIPRRDFSPAQAREYLQSLETLFSASLLMDLAGGLAFGQIPLEGEIALFGLPYLFDLLIGAHTQPMGKADERLSFADVLANEASFLFPAARANGLNQTFYHQYLAAGGTGPSDGLMTIDEAALLKVLRFYESLLQGGLVSPDALSYPSPRAYINELMNRDERQLVAIISVSDYLALIEQETQLMASEIPTADANGSAILNGWLWVMVRPDRNRQTLAARFLEWLMEPVFHADLARALHHLPSQPAILADSLPGSADGELLAQLLERAALPLPEGEGGAVPRLMQEALIDLLHGEATAADATEQALGALAER